MQNCELVEKAGSLNCAYPGRTQECNFFDLSTAFCSPCSKRAVDLNFD